MPTALSSAPASLVSRHWSLELGLAWPKQCSPCVLHLFLVLQWRRLCLCLAQLALCPGVDRPTSLGSPPAGSSPLLHDPIVCSVYMSWFCPLSLLVPVVWSWPGQQMPWVHHGHLYSEPWAWLVLLKKKSNRLCSMRARFWLPVSLIEPFRTNFHWGPWAIGGLVLPPVF